MLPLEEAIEVFTNNTHSSATTSNHIYYSIHWAR